MEEGGRVSEEAGRVIALDMEYEEWFVNELHAYREAVGVNAPYAHIKVVEAQTADFVDLVSRFGEGLTEEGFELPADWRPVNIFSIDSDYLLGFAWITARRERPELTFEQYAGEVKAGDLLMAFAETLTALIPEDEEAPDAGQERPSGPFVSPTPTPTSRPSKRRSSSRTASAGRSKKSAPSA